MGEYRLLPLGIDIGTTRARVALVEANRGGSTRLRAIVSRDVPEGALVEGLVESPELVAALLEEMIDELGVRERRCILSLGVPSALLRVLRFPRMSWAERSRAGRFEAQRFAPWDLDAEPTLVRVHPVNRDDHLFAVGIVREEALRSRVKAAKAAGLKPIAVDYDACALRRALPLGDAVIDVGAARTSLHVYAAQGPLSWSTPVGGADITRSIARELSIDVVTAERRKRILGSAGAGASAQDEVIAKIAAVVERARGRAGVARIAITGNGARLPGFAQDLESATGAVVEMPVAQLLETEAYPEDVVRAAAPDWTLAAGLALYGVAA